MTRLTNLRWAFLNGGGYWYLPRLGLVVGWNGVSGMWQRYRWGIIGQRWPTFYCGAFKVITGPPLPEPPAKEAE